MKKCAKCDKEIECMIESGADQCWCEGIKIPPTVCDFVSAVYGDCLCSECLAEICKESIQ